MRTDEAWPGFGCPFTVAELDRMPSDGHRYELLDGVLVVGPRPSTVHQAMAGRLLGELNRARPKGLCVVAEPAVQLSQVTELCPQLVVVRLDDVGGAKFTAPPVLELQEGRYVRMATSTQSLTLSQPFRVTIGPADLTKSILRQPGAR